MATCGVCVKSIRSNQLKVVCSDCAREFHASCCDMSKADVEAIAAEGLPWRCKPCGQNRRRSLRFDVEVSEGNLTLDDIMKKISEMFEHQKTQEANFNKSYEHITEKIDENTKAVNDHNKSLEKCLEQIDTLVEKNRKLERKVTELEQRVEEMEQYSRSNAVEIHGVPEQQHEDVVKVVQELGKALDMDIAESMIDACHRLGRSKGPSSPPPGIIVKFVRRLDKEELLRRRRVKSNLSTRHMNLKVDQPVYVNESLSPARRRLFAEARQIKRQKEYKFLWVRGGKIFLRQQESAPVHQVTCQADLLSL